MGELALFFSGALLCNSIPHLAAGLQENAFPTPFAKPRGVGDSSPVVNVLWGLLNLWFGVMLIHYQGSADQFMWQSIVTMVGAAVMGIYLAAHFSRVKAKRSIG
jgi:hypothetical protein